MFVQLENTVEGLIRFENIGNEYFDYDENTKRLIGKRTNKIYKIGDKVKIRVISANKMLRQVDFEIYDAEDEKDEKIEEE
jgi:ribonuclease R